MGHQASCRGRTRRSASTAARRKRPAGGRTNSSSRSRVKAPRVQLTSATAIAPEAPASSTRAWPPLTVAPSCCVDSMAPPIEPSATRPRLVGVTGGFIGSSDDASVPASTKRPSPYARICGDRRPSVGCGIELAARPEHARPVERLPGREGDVAEQHDRAPVAAEGELAGVRWSPASRLRDRAREPVPTMARRWPPRPTRRRLR